MASSPEFEREVVLIIDDNEQNQYTFKRYLRAEGFEIWSAGTGRDGLEKAQQGPSLIMLDVQLPDTTGYEICQKLKSDPATSSIPVLHTSATYTESSDRAQGLEGGADGYLTQPIDAHELRATVRALLRVRAAEQKLHRLNQELEQRVDERTTSLREAMLQLEQFSYAVSHDLRAPLRAMQGYSTALLEDHSESLPDEAVEYLKRIATNASRLDKMIVDILSFNKLSKTEPQLQRVSLARAVQEILKYYPGLNSPAAEIHCDLTHEVLANESVLAQAISNLLSNAVKFVAPGVTPKVRIWSAERGSIVRLTIEDNGIGIAPESQARLFGMFERVLPAGSYEGTGVGLAIARKSVERMNGTMSMESDGVHGCRFWIELPNANDKR